MSTARVCFVCPRVYGYFNPEAGFAGGGAERQIHFLSTNLADRFDVHIVVGDYDQPRREHREGVTLHRAYPLHPRQNIVQPVKHLTVLAQAMRRANADVYIHRGNPRNAAFVRLLARLLRSGWIYNIANDADLGHRLSALPGPVQWLYIRALRDADAVIAQTTDQQRLLREGYSINAAVVPNGYSAVEQPPNTDGEYFLWVGRLDERQKRPHLYLDCAEHLPSERFRLIGAVNPKDSYHRRIQRRARNLDNVELVGQVAPDDIHDHYRDALALVSTSAYEGFPNVFLEAWRQGTPVVSLDVDPGRYGIPDEVCAGGDLGRLKQLLQRVANDDAHRDELGRNARDLFETEFKQSIVVRQYGDAIQHVLEG